MSIVSFPWGSTKNARSLGESKTDRRCRPHHNSRVSEVRCGKDTIDLPSFSDKRQDRQASAKREKKKEHLQEHKEEEWKGVKGGRLEDRKGGRRGMGCLCVYACEKERKSEAAHKQENVRK